MNLRFANDKLTELIHRLAEAWGCDPYDINCGECENFAMAVLDENNRLEVKFEDIGEVGPEEFVGLEHDLPGHVWIVCGNKHYDAECPEGVENWQDLPIFKRLREK